jgi:S1-C subfamily serine protease
VLATLVAFAALAAIARADDAARGYARVRASLVKIWAFDAGGRPVESGSGVVVVSNHDRSIVLTAAHVVAGAARIAVDVDRDRHDLVAHVGVHGPHDLVTLEVDGGDLAPVTFAPRTRSVIEGNLIAVAGFVKHDELIGSVGQEPRLLYPGTISSRPENGTYLELENVHVEEGLSGGAVFDPQSGDVLGVVTSRTTDQRGGFADAAATVVLPFLASHAIAFRESGASPSPKPVAVAPKSVAPSPKPIATAHPAVVVMSPPPPMLVAAAPPPALPVVVTKTARSWEARESVAHKLAYYHHGCAIVLALTVTDLAFAIPSSDDDTDGARLRLRVARRVAPIAACQDVAESTPSDADYAADASSYDGHHITIRFSRVVDGEPNAADVALFPGDISVDADVTGAPVTAHVQLVDADWDDQIDVIASTRR